MAKMMSCLMSVIVESALGPFRPPPESADERKLFASLYFECSNHCYLRY
jgi:hypothetical protein